MSGNLLAKAEKYALAGKLDDARRLCEQVLKAQPRNIPANFLLGSVCFLGKKYGRSEELFRKVLADEPNNIEVLNNLGVIQLEHYKDFEQAAALFNRVVGLNPNHVKALTNLGNIQFRLGRHGDAERFYSRALQLNPNEVGVLNGMGMICGASSRFGEARQYYERALAVSPDNPDVLTNLITTEYMSGDRLKALALVRRVADLQAPGLTVFPAFSYAKKHCLWDIVEKVQPRLMKMIEGQALTPNLFQMVNLDLISSDQVGNEVLFAIHRKAGDTIKSMRARAPSTEPWPALQVRGKLRIGYLSADFRAHAVNHFFRGLVNHYDRQLFEVYCYSNAKPEDQDFTTRQYRETVDNFIDVYGLSDVELAERIRGDGIHVLVELGGFTTNNRVPVLSHSPAPVQIGYLGYPYSYGLDEVDYVISDPWLDGPNNARYFAEKPLRLPESFITFGELLEQCIEPGIPAQRNGHVTFGSMANAYKLNPHTIAVWSRVLKAMPGSRFILNHPNYGLEATRESILREFAGNGIEPERIGIIWEKHPHGVHLRYYNDIDITLDTFPLTGGTTTIDALWMGAPVVTLVGDAHAQRLSYSIIKNAGLPLEDTIAFGEDEYVAKALVLARNLARIAELRTAIPLAMRNTVLCDPVKFTRQMEAAYVEAWNRKFPQFPINAALRSEATGFVALRGGSEVAVSGSLNDVHTYVLKEQAGWFEAECDFLANIAQPGMNVLDISADPGFYALPLAARVADEGAAIALRLSAESARLLELGKQHGGRANLRVVRLDLAKVQLDEISREWPPMDIVRLSSETNDGAGGLAKNGLAFFLKASPLVMFSVRHGELADLTALPVFMSLGYDIYCLIPGLGVLAPYSAGQADAFSLNLFACKPDRAAELESRGVLVSQVQAPEQLPDADDRDWLDCLGELPYAANLLPGWLETGALPGADGYRRALNLFAKANDSRYPLSHRAAFLQSAFEMAATAAAAATSLPRLFSAARIATEFGRREAGVAYLNLLAELYDAGGEITVDEPFLAVNREWETIDPNGKLAEWLFASVMEQREKLRAFSSYFTGQEALPILEMITRTGLYTAETPVRLRLIRQRYRLE